jgi:hypothetical protein
LTHLRPSIALNVIEATGPVDNVVAAIDPLLGLAG